VLGVNGSRGFGKRKKSSGWDEETERGKERWRGKQRYLGDQVSGGKMQAGPRWQEGETVIGGPLWRGKKRS